MSRRRRRRSAPIAGVSSPCVSLGSGDPRARRSHQALGSTDVSMGGALRIDKNQRLTVNKAALVNYTGGDQAILGLIRSLKDADLMEN